MIIINNYWWIFKGQTALKTKKQLGMLSKNKECESIIYGWFSILGTYLVLKVQKSESEVVYNNK